MRITCVVALAICLLPIVAAHGGDDTLEEETISLSNAQIGIIGVLVTITAGMLNSNGLLLSDDFLPVWATTFAVYTGIVHVLLGINEPLLLVGGIGVMGVVITSFWRRKDPGLNRWRWLVLSATSLAMFVGYFLSNHDLHAMTEDGLGITSKIAELGVIVGSIRQLREQP